MFTTLLESGYRRSANPLATTISSLFHIALAAAAVTLSAKPAATVDGNSLEPTIIALVPPAAEPTTPAPVNRTPVEPSAAIAPPHPRTQPVNIDLNLVSVPTAIPRGIPELDLTARVSGEVSFAPPSESTPLTAYGTGRSNTAGGGGAYWPFEVERGVTLPPGSPEPRYPASLARSGMAGIVRVAFIVDTTGRALLESVNFLESSHSAFTSEVLRVLPRYRFTPAEVGGSKVAQHVVLPFEFRIR